MNPSDIVRADLFGQVLEYRLANPTATIEESCAAVGIAKSSFYRWVAMDSEAMVAVKDALNDAQRGALFEYSQRIYSALTMLLDDAVNTKLKTETRLKVLKFAIPLFDDLAKVHHATPGGEDRAPFLKKGPVLEHAQSRLATLDLAITEDGVRVDILRDQPIIEAFLQDPESEAEAEDQVSEADTSSQSAG